MIAAAVMTENGYPLCQRHADAWRWGGNDAVTRPLEPGEAGWCTDCADAAGWRICGDCGEWARPEPDADAGWLHVGTGPADTVIHPGGWDHVAVPAAPTAWLDLSDDPDAPNDARYDYVAVVDDGEVIATYPATTEAAAVAALRDAGWQLTEPWQMVPSGAAAYVRRAAP